MLLNAKDLTIWLTVAIILKRMICSGSPEKCFTYKVAHCIDSGKNKGGRRRRRAYFKYKTAQRATRGEYENAYVSLPARCTNVQPNRWYVLAEKAEIPLG